MKVAVLGAGGTTGRAVARDLAESSEVSALLLIDRDRAAVAQTAAEQAPGMGEALGLDSDDELAAAIAGCRVLVNAASHQANLEAMEAALEAGCHYVDLGAGYATIARQLELDERFIAAGLIAVVGMGASPGMTNVMADRAVSELGGERVLELHVSVAGRDPGDGVRLPYALPRLIEELSMAAVVLEDGVARKLPPLSSGGLVEFPDPIGPSPTIYTLHPELQTFGRSFGVPRASFRLSLSPALRRQLEELRGASEEELAAASAACLPPSEQAIAAHVVEAGSARRLVRVSAVTGPIAAWGVGGGIVATAAPAAALVRLIARGKVEPVGVVPPENAADHRDLLPELELRGVALTVEVVERGLPA